MKFQPKKPPSAAELRLAEARKAKGEAEAEMEVARTVIARLEAAARAPAPIAAELAMVDKDDAAAMSQWAAPTPDADRRSELLKRLAIAEAQARSAAGAMAEPRDALNAAGQRAAAAARAARIAAKLVAIEEADATLPPLQAAIAQIYEAKRRVDAARNGVLADLKPDGDDAREIFVALHAFDLRRREAEAIPMAELKAPDGIVPDGAHELARALAQLGPVGNTWDRAGLGKLDRALSGFSA